MTISHRNRNCGFTLVELAIAMIIIGLLLVVNFKVQPVVLRGGQMLDTIAIAKDISVASQTFRQRYHYLPGDFPVDQEIAELPGGCRPDRDDAEIIHYKGDGNGLISAGESVCVPAQLIVSGLLKGDPAKGLASSYGPISVIASTSSKVTGLPAKVQNVIEFSNLPCDVAQEIDAKLDDGKLRDGNIQANLACSITTSAPDSSGKAVPVTVVNPYVYLAVPL